MSQIPQRQRLSPQKTYRKRQTQKHLVRYELQVNAQSKARFEAMVAEVADEYTEPYDKRQRLSKARAHLFNEITQGIAHQFTTLTEEIAALKAEIKTLSSPTLFQTDLPKTSLPETIRILPDDSAHLKSLLACAYQQIQQINQKANEYERRANQYLKLYETISVYNDDLKSRLEALETLQKDEKS